MGRRQSEPAPAAERILRSQLVPLALRWIATQGVDAEAIARRAGLRFDPRATEVNIPLERVSPLLDGIAERMSEPWLGLRLAAWRPEGSHGLLEYFWRSAPTVRDSLVALATHARLVNELVRMVLRVDGAVALFGQTTPGSIGGLGRHANEFFVATVAREFRQLTGSRLAPRGVTLAHPRPKLELQPLYEALGTREIRWNSDASGLEFDAHLLDVPLRTASAPLFDSLQTHAAQWTPDVVAADDAALSSRIEAYVIKHVRDPSLTLASCARATGVSTRTLQRTLSARGETFRTVRDAARATVAQRLVIDGRLTLKEIAPAVGFETPASFVRAFRRWTGTTPRSFAAK